MTRNGWATLVAAVASFAAGRLLGLIELYVVGTALTIALCAAGISVLRTPPALSVRRRVSPGVVAAGEPARVDLRVTNGRGPGGRGRRTATLDLWETVGGRGGAAMRLAPLAIGASDHAAYRVPTATRGLVALGPLVARYGDPLGLFRRQFTVAGAPAELLVVPTHVVLPFPGISGAGRVGEVLRTKALGRTGTEFHSHRDYVPGDDLRRISWKTTARVGNLIVRETALEGVHRCTVVLDTLKESYDAEAFERAVSAAASVVIGAVEAGVTCRLIAPRLDLRGPEIAGDALRVLADIRESTDVVDPTMFGRTHGDGLGVLVVVTSGAGSAAARLAANVAAPDDTVMVVAITAPGSGDGRRIEIDATSLPTFEREWRRAVGGGRVGAA